MGGLFFDFEPFRAGVASVASAFKPTEGGLPGQLVAERCGRHSRTDQRDVHEGGARDAVPRG